MGRGAAGTIGDRAEQHALEYLRREGLEVVARNYQTRGGEIDLVMLHDECLVFVEVRYRRTTAFANPALTVDANKQRRIVRTAARFLARSHRYAGRPVRFDVVAISGAGLQRVEWLRDAFRPRDAML